MMLRGSLFAPKLPLHNNTATAEFTGNGLEDFVIQGDREVLVYTQREL